MMSTHRILNLPEDPFISDDALQQAIISCGPEMAARDKVYFDVDKLIKPEILESFANIGVTPVFAIILHRPGWFGCKEKRQEHTKIHVDLTGSNGNFIKIPCAVNWQITPGKTFFTWWDTKGAIEVYPSPMPKEGTYQYYLNSILYNNRDSFEYKDYSIIENVEFDKPMLVRTDVPHSVIYNTGDQVRCSVSIRFGIKEIKDWGHALDIFKPLIV